MSFRAAAFTAVFLSALSGLTGCEACKAPSKAADASTDAASSTASSTAAALDAAAEAKPRDRTLVAIAEGSSDAKLAPTFDGRIVVLSGAMPYEAKPNGALEPLVGGAALAPLYPDDDTFVGFLDSSTSVQWVRGDLGGTPGPLLLDGFAGARRKTFAVRDRKLVAASTPVEASHVARWKGKLLGASFGMKQNEMAWLDDKSEPAPPPVAKIPNITGLAVDAQGTLVVLGFSSYERPRAALFPATWKAGDAPTIVEGAQSPSCSLVPSFDASVVLRCAEGPGFGEGTKFFRIAKTGFERIFPHAPSGVSSGSIGKDGALYVVLPKVLIVLRCAADASKCLPIEVKTDFTPIETAQYELNVSDVVERKGDYEMGDRSWTTIKVEYNATKDAIGGSASILARDENDIWVFARNYRRGVLFHSTDDPQRERTRLPSHLDGRFIAKNASPPQPWTGHCEQVFVRLPAEDAKRGADVEKALGAKPLAYDSPFNWWVVEGRLHEDKVSGVVIVRRDVEEKLEKMERATEKLVDAFTPNPMSKPKVYCTLPVLERVLHPAKP
jgi:hypothetical protein